MHDVFWLWWVGTLVSHKILPFTRHRTLVILRTYQQYLSSILRFSRIYTESSRMDRT
jgi:hypothetical protein